MPADEDAARLAIFEKYETGREGGIEVEDWEDPNLELYAVTDRYGFMHKTRLPPTHPSAKDLEIMRQRALKWNKMLQKWDAVESTPTMRRRVFKGVPESVRLAVWSRFLNLDEIRCEGQYEAAYYAAREQGKFRDMEQIDKDIARRFREHVLFRERYGQGQQILFRILAAYTMYNEEVGYCQGMDAIAGLLMMYMNEEDAYWAMCRLMSGEKFAMHGLYVGDLRKLHEMCNHHNTIRKKVTPRVNKHLEKVGFDPTLYGTKWFMEGFQERLPFPLVLRVWDVYLYLGESVMHAMAASLVKLFRKQMMKQSFEQLHEFMKDLPQYKFDNDDVMEQLDIMLVDLSKQKLSTFPRAVSMTFLPEKPPPEYPPAPEPFRSLTLRRQHRLTIQSLPAGVGFQRESLVSGGSLSEGATSPGADSTMSMPMIVPMVREGVSEKAGSGEGAAASPSTPSVPPPDSHAANGVSGSVNTPADLKISAEPEEPVTSDTASTPRAENQSDIAPVVSNTGESSVAESSVAESNVAELKVAESNAVGSEAAGPALANGDVAGYAGDELSPTGSDTDLRIRVSTI